MAIQLIEKRSGRHVAFADNTHEALESAYWWAAASGRSVRCIHIPTGQTEFIIPPYLLADAVGHMIWGPRSAFHDIRLTAPWN
jgi:hypothetical protein